MYSKQVESCRFSPVVTGWRGRECVCWGMCWDGGGYSEKVKNWKGMKDMDSKFFCLTH